MTETSTETRSVIIEREMPYPPEKIWRALTQSALIAEWLMKNDFKPVVDHRSGVRSRTAPDRGVADEERLQAGRGPTLQSSR